MIRRLITALVSAPLIALATQLALPRLDGIRVDGDPADWAGRGLRFPILAPDSPLPPDRSRSHAEARIAWDEHGLIFLVSVLDATPHEAHRASGAYLADSVELFLASDPARPEAVQLVISPGRDPAQGVPRAYLYDYRPDGLRAKPTAPEWGVRPVVGTALTQIEARLPWSALGLQPMPSLVIGARLCVNDSDGEGRRTRFAWQPAADGGRYHALTLSLSGDAHRAHTAPIAWLAVDPALPGCRLNLVAPLSSAGSTAQVSNADGSRKFEIPLIAAGSLAQGSSPLPNAQTGDGSWHIMAGGTVLTLPDTAAQLAADTVTRAHVGWRLSPAEKRDVAFAQFAFTEYVFAGDAFPAPAFVDPDRVNALLGRPPEVETRWFDARGAEVHTPAAPGLYGARSTLTLAGRASPLVLEHHLYRLPAGATVPPVADELAARLLGFELAGADATPSHAARVAERWWHRLRRANGWSAPLPFELRVPADMAVNPRPRPLIVYLHGSGEQHTETVQVVLDWIATHAGDDAIILCPMSSRPWRGPSVGEVIDTVSRTHPVDPDRVYLVGFSMGGIGAWEVALDQPERFAAIVPIGGRMGAPADAARLRQVPAWIINGAEDPTTTPEEAAIMRDALARAGATARLTLYPGVAHGESRRIALTSPGLWTWLLTQRRN